MAKVKKGPRKNQTRGAQISKDRNRHKVVLPNNSKENGKQLQSAVRRRFRAPPKGAAHRSHQITFKAEPPQGYTFIPAGNPELTAALKEFSRQGNHKIFAVTVSALL